MNFKQYGPVLFGFHRQSIQVRLHQEATPNLNSNRPYEAESTEQFKTMSAKSCSQNATELPTNRIMVLAKSICPSKIFASQTQERQAKEDVFHY